uniref:ATP synthase complex subunit 8 n=1 Tax=Leptomantella albella TaxID=627747 RepID=X5DAC4_LEPAB|nr:ATP synthase F0 subunit 8 [Leptomantella albella]AHW52364.1 ATP synthase F0 subunit 8 [Leptomantella albella]
MPQMMPLNWLMLSTIFSMLLIIFAIMNFYSLYHKPSTKNFYKKTSYPMNWKW